jgi:hypothetical protein
MENGVTHITLQVYGYYDNYKVITSCHTPLGYSIGYATALIIIVYTCNTSKVPITPVPFVSELLFWIKPKRRVKYREKPRVIIAIVARLWLIST